MGNQIKLQNIDMSKVGDTAGKIVKDAANFVRDHKEKFLGGSLLLALAKFGLILVVLIWLSILFCIDNMCLFHTLFFVSHIFSTIPVPLHFFIIVCSSGGLQVGLLFTE